MPSTTKDIPTTRELLVVGRPEGGAPDPETGQRAPGGVSWYDGGEEKRAESGDLIVVPVKIADSLLKNHCIGSQADFEALVAIATYAPAPEEDPDYKSGRTDIADGGYTLDDATREALVAAAEVDVEDETEAPVNPALLLALKDDA